MGDDDGWRIIGDGLAKNFSHPHLGLIDAALIKLGQAHHPISSIQVDHPQFFMVERTKERKQDIERVRGTLDCGAFGWFAVQFRVQFFMELADFGQGFLHFTTTALWSQRVC